MSLRKVASSLAFCCARAATNVSIAPASAAATYSNQRQCSRRLRTALPVDAVILELLATRDKSLQGMSQRVPHTLFLSAMFCKQFYLSNYGRAFGALFPFPQPPFAGNSPVLAESRVHAASRKPILSMGPANRPSGGKHGGTANNPSEPDLDCRRIPPGCRIPYSLLEPGCGCGADSLCHRKYGRTRSGNAAGAGSGLAAWSAGLRVRPRRVLVRRPAILGIILAADPDSGRGASSA